MNSTDKKRLFSLLAQVEQLKSEPEMLEFLSTWRAFANQLPEAERKSAYQLLASVIGGIFENFRHALDTATPVSKKMAAQVLAPLPIPGWLSPNVERRAVLAA